MRLSMTWMTVLLFATAAMAADGEDVFDRVEHHWADSDGVKIHYVTLGQGRPVIFVHGFPDWWYTWREQMDALSDDFLTVALDTRGYNRSDKPRGVENYSLDILAADIDAVRRDIGADKVTVVGHDWGGAISWWYAMTHKEHIERLVILNLTHPSGFANVVAHGSEEQKANTQYARRFIATAPDENASAAMYAAVGASSGPVVHERYKTAMAQSYRDGMLNYYRANYALVADGGLDPVQVEVPVLQFHGLTDTAVDKDGLRDTWNWIDSDYTLVTLPGVGHWVQREGAAVVNATMRAWLLARQ